MTDKPTYFAVKSMYPAESMEIAQRIEWCKTNEIQWFSTAILGVKVGEVFYEKEEMQEIGELELKDNSGVTQGIIDLSTLPPKNIGIGFVFYNEVDASAFKLAWT